MRVLALDTTTRAGSVALVEDDRILAEEIGDADRSHAERLPTDLMRVLAAHRLTPADIDLFAVAAGPGSFTGLRIGIATMQGLAFATRKRIVPTSLLEALAQVASRELAAGAVVGAWVDAHRREVFSALYRIGSAAPFTPDRVVEIEPPSVGDPGQVLARWGAAREAVAAIAGDGAVLYAAQVSDEIRIVAPPPLAGAIGCMAVFRARAGATVDPAGVQPLYIRRPDAELARER